MLISVTSAASIDAYLYGGHGDDDEEDEDDVEPALRLLVDEHNDGAGHEHQGRNRSHGAQALVEGESGCALKDADDEEENLHRLAYLREEHLEEGDLFGLCVE